jgi:hypothetical protein
MITVLHHLVRFLPFLCGGSLQNNGSKCNAGGNDLEACSPRATDRHAGKPVKLPFGQVGRGESPRIVHRLRLSLTAESGRLNVVKVGKAPRCGLPTDGVSRAAQVGWWPALDQRVSVVGWLTFAPIRPTIPACRVQRSCTGPAGASPA